LPTHQQLIFTKFLDGKLVAVCACMFEKINAEDFRVQVGCTLREYIERITERTCRKLTTIRL
jgi:hypothetical protein